MPETRSRMRRCIRYRHLPRLLHLMGLLVVAQELRVHREQLIAHIPDFLKA